MCPTQIRPTVTVEHRMWDASVIDPQTRDLLDGLLPDIDHATWYLRPATTSCRQEKPRYPSYVTSTESRSFEPVMHTTAVRDP